MKESELINILTKYNDEEYKKFHSMLICLTPGGYGEKDKLIGVKVPILRKIAKEYEFSFLDIETLITSVYHDIRLLMLIILVNKYKEDKEKVLDIYLANTKYINNWDLVDLSSKKIIGRYSFETDNTILERLSKSCNEWERRICIVATWYYISKGELKYPLDILKRHILDEFPLNHKAVGWMLREIGKKDKNLLMNFLEDNIFQLKSITLNYAMEKFSNEEKRHIRKMRKGG